MHNRFADVTDRLSRVESLSALMRALADEARRVVDAPLARIDAFDLLGEEGPAMASRASSGECFSRWATVDLPLTEGLMARVAPTLSALISQDVQREFTPLSLPTAFEAQLALEGIHGLIALPLTIDGRCGGILTVADRMMRPWTATEIEGLQQLATVAVRALRRMAKSEAQQQALQQMRQPAARLLAPVPAAGQLVGRLAEAVAASDTSVGPHPLAALLAQAPQAARDAFIGQSIGALLQADLTRGAPLALTLFTYMEHGHNARAAAKALGVHVNTLHNRLESITGVLPGWNEPGRCLDVHLALRLSLGAVELKDSHAGA